MATYMGSKRRLVKHYKEILEEHITDDNWYVEPFSGGMNMIKGITAKNYMANDINKYIIAAYSKYNLENIPSLDVVKVGRSKYNEFKEIVKQNIDIDHNDFIGLVGMASSFGGKFYVGGYIGEYDNEKYMNCHYNGVLKDFVWLKDRKVNFSSVSYQDMIIPDGSVVYCDPPYKGTHGYNTKIDHEQFYTWAKELSKRCYVYISEYNMPDDFECIKTVIVNSQLGINKKEGCVEKLYRVKGGI